MSPLLRLLVATAAVAGFPAIGAADHAETEARLKRAGVDAKTRTKIHRAIDRSVAYLVKKQERNGAFRPRTHLGFQPASTSGYTALCVLALRHAGTRNAKRAAERGLRYLVPGKSRGRRGLHEQVYTAGIGLMVLEACGGHGEAAREIARKLAGGNDKRTGWWGYYNATRAERAFLDAPNLSTTQWGALGLWAARRMGAPVPPAVWRRQLKGLLASQTETGSWPYVWANVKAPKDQVPQEHGYPTGTYIGLANLILCERALQDELTKEGREQVRRAKARALRVLARDVPKTLETFATRVQKWHRSFYALYALEKVCVFLGRREVGGVDWYRTGARRLLETQNRDGGWGRTFSPDGKRVWRVSQIVDTAFGLLFLLRSSEAYHPVTPRGIDTEAGPTTPSER